MAEAGNPWAIKTLAEASRIGRLAGLRGQALQRIKKGCARDGDERLAAIVLPKRVMGSHQAKLFLDKPTAGAEAKGYDGDAPPWEDAHTQSAALGERMARDRDPREAA